MPTKPTDTTSRGGKELAAKHEEIFVKLTIVEQNHEGRLFWAKCDDCGTQQPCKYVQLFIGNRGPMDSSGFLCSECFAALEANAKPNESLKALEVAVEALPRYRALNGGTKADLGAYIKRDSVLKLIAEATKQEEPKEMRAG